MKNKLISIFLIFLIVGIPFSYAELSGDVSRASLGGKDGVDVFDVDIIKQTPPVIPAVALEQKSDAIVRFFVDISNLDMINSIDIERIKAGSVRAVGDDGKSVGIKRFSFNVFTDLQGDGDSSAKGMFEVQFSGGLSRGYYRRPELNSENIRDFCAEMGRKVKEEDVVPDVINLEGSLRLEFSARNPSNDEYLDKDYYELDGSDLTRRESGEEISSGRKKIISDVVYFNQAVAIDKTRLYNPSPEEIKRQICRVQDWVDDVSSVFDKMEDVENFMSTGCYVSIGVAAVEVLFLGMDPCDAMDTISLSCDWIWCPSKKCKNVNPTEGGLLASTFMCWGNDPFIPFRRFFGKENEGNDEEDIVCKGKGKVPVPHFACISGITYNLDLIRIILKKYQECLMASYSSGGSISVGVCDRLKSVYLCDRVLGEVLGMSGFTPGGFISNFLKKGLGRSVDYVFGEGSVDEMKERFGVFKNVLKKSTEDYENAHWSKLLADKNEFIKQELCESFVSGKFYNLESLKGGLILPSYPDSYYVMTEKRMWDCDVMGDSSNVVAGMEFDECVPISYSYDVFYQIFAGSKREDRLSSSYSVFLRGNRNKMGYDDEGNLKEIVVDYGRCDIPVKRGNIKDGGMVQENIFSIVGIEDCNAEEQCIQFRGNTNCEPIGLRSSLSSSGSLDPFNILSMGVSDNDDDGMTDRWERIYDLDPDDSNDWGDDNDGDGFCNVIEFMEGTHPGNSESKPEDDALKGKCDEKYEEARRVARKYSEREDVEEERPATDG